jgi:HTH-type transcriptional regulator/antitoxin HigA
MMKTDMRIRPIKTKQDHRAAVARIEALMSALPDTPEGDELEVLATLVDAYEAKHHVIDAPDPVSAIQFRMEQQQLSRKDLEPFIGSRARVSEVLTGKRPLTLAMVRRVRSGLGISADLLIAPAPAFGKNRRTSRNRPVSNGDSCHDTLSFRGGAGYADTKRPSDRTFR